MYIPLACPDLSARKTMLHLGTLGLLQLTGPDGEEFSDVLAQPKRLALLAYLAVARPHGFHRRDTLVALFWPECDDVRARRALSQSLYYLRQHLPAGILQTRGREEVGLVPDRVTTDVQRFDSAVAEGRWADALEEYQGDFLSGLHVGGAHAFEDWAALERDRLREAAAWAAWTLAEERIEEADIAGAELAAHRALDLVWTDEAPVQDFVKALARRGDRAAALSFYEQFRVRLRQDLDLEPSTQTRAVVEAIRTGGFPEEAATPVPPTEGPTEAADAPPDSSQTSAPAPTVTRAQSPPPARPRRRWGRWLFAVTVAAAVVGVAKMNGGVSPQAPDPLPTQPPPMILASVAGTADSQEREAVEYLLRTGLDLSGVVKVVPDQELARTLALMERREDAPLDGVTAREAGVRLGVPTLMITRMDRLGATYSLGIRLEDVTTGELLVGVTGVTADTARVVELADSLLVDLLRGLGGSAQSLADREPLPQVLTSSLEALASYHQGRLAMGRAQPRLAASLFRRAVELDTAFAMAWSHLASTYGNYLGELDSAEAANGQATRFAHRLTSARREDQRLHSRLKEDIALWDLALEEAEVSVSHDPSYANNYAFYLAREGGRLDSAVNVRLAMERRHADQARRIDPMAPYESPCGNNTNAWAAAAGRLGELAAFRDSLGAGIRDVCSAEIDLFAALSAADWDRADSLVQAGEDGWRLEEFVQMATRQLTPVRGRIRATYQLPDSVCSCARNGWSDIGRLLMDVAYGPPPGWELDHECPAELEGRGRSAVTDFVFHAVGEALVGDTLAAQRMAQRLTAMRDSATSQTFERAFGPWFALLEVGPATQRGDWESAVARLEPVAEALRSGAGGFIGGDTFLTWWVLSQGYAETGHPESAISALESLLRPPRHRIFDWTLQGFIRPAARLRLARLYADTGQGVLAQAHYAAFLATFTDPDPEVQWMVDEAQAALDLRS